MLIPTDDSQAAKAIASSRSVDFEFSGEDRNQEKAARELFSTE
jgi:hypothetical protein